MNQKLMGLVSLCVCVFSVAAAAAEPPRTMTPVSRAGANHTSAKGTAASTAGQHGPTRFQERDAALNRPRRVEAPLQPIDSAVAGGSSDSCGGALSISSTGNFAFDNNQATTDGPAHTACEFAGGNGLITRDVWYCWTAPADCIVTIETCGNTTVDTMIGVYEGCTFPVTDERLVACADDDCVTRTSLEFNADNGETYLIRLGSAAGAGGGTGSFSLSCQEPLLCNEPETNCVERDNTQARASNGTDFVVADDFSPTTSGAIDELCWWGGYSGLNLSCDGTSSNDFQVTYYEDAGGLPGAAIGTFSQGGASLTVDGPVDTGMTLAEDFTEYEFHATHAPVNVQAGECYWVEIFNDVTIDDCIWFWEDGVGGLVRRSLQDGSPMDGYGIEDVRPNDHAFCLNRSIATPNDCLPPAPANDLCENAETVTDGVTFFETYNAGTDGPAEPSCEFVLDDDQINQDVWFEYEATCTGMAQISLCGSQFDTKLGVYEGTQCPVSSILACNDDFCGEFGLESRVLLPVTQGETYKIRAGGFADDVGPGRLEISCGETPPNLSCTTTPVETLNPDSSVAFTGSNTISDNECAAFTGGHVWIAFDLTEPGSVTLDYTGTTPVFEDAWINLVEGCPCAEVSAPADCVGDAPDGNVTMTWDCVPAGTYYYPVLSGPGSEGNYTINVSTTPCIDRCGASSGDCFTPHAGGGCDDAACCETVCDVDSFCCCVEWDSICVDVANNVCGFAETCQNAVGHCCEAQPENVAGCSDMDCCLAVCQCDPFCCNTEWDANCATEGFGETGCGAGVLCEMLCEPCPEGEYSCVSPQNGAQDSRQPHPPSDPGTLQGISQVLTAGPEGADSASCWSVVETTQNVALHPPGLGTLEVSEVIDNNNGTFLVVLSRPIAPGESAVLTYTSASGSSMSTCTYAALPGDVTLDQIVTPQDILAAMDAINEAAPLPNPQVDFNRDTIQNADDIERLLQLFIGDVGYGIWFGASMAP